MGTEAAQKAMVTQPNPLMQGTQLNSTNIRFLNAENVSLF